MARDYQPIRVHSTRLSQAHEDDLEATAALEAEGAVHLASDDYPEMGQVLHDRPDPGTKITVVGSRRVATDTYGRPDDARDEDYNGPQGETGLRWAEPGEQEWVHQNLGPQESVPPPPWAPSVMEAEMDGEMPPAMARLAQIEEACQLIGARHAGTLHRATDINGTHVDDHGDAPGHGTVPRATEPNAYDARSTEGDGDPRWSGQDDPQAREKNGAAVAMYPEGMSAGGGPGLEIGAFTAHNYQERSPYELEQHLIGEHGVYPVDLTDLRMRAWHTYPEELERAHARVSGGRPLDDWMGESALVHGRLMNNVEMRDHLWREHGTQVPGNHSPGELQAEHEGDHAALSFGPGERHGLSRRTEADVPDERGPDSADQATYHAHEGPLDPIFGSRVPWTGAERGTLHTWQDVPTGTWGDFVPSGEFLGRDTHRSPEAQAERDDERARELRSESAVTDQYPEWPGAHWYTPRQERARDIETSDEDFDPAEFGVETATPEQHAEGGHLKLDHTLSNRHEEFRDDAGDYGGTADYHNPGGPGETERFDPDLYATVADEGEHRRYAGEDDLADSLGLTRPRGGLFDHTLSSHHEEPEEPGRHYEQFPAGIPGWNGIADHIAPGGEYLNPADTQEYWEDPEDYTGLATRPDHRDRQENPDAGAGGWFDHTLSRLAAFGADPRDEAYWREHLMQHHGWTDANVARSEARGQRFAHMHDALHSMGMANHEHQDPGEVARARELSDRFGQPYQAPVRGYSHPKRGGTPLEDPADAIAHAAPVNWQATFDKMPLSKWSAVDPPHEHDGDDNSLDAGPSEGDDGLPELHNDLESPDAPEGIPGESPDDWPLAQTGAPAGPAYTQGSHDGHGGRVFPPPPPPPMPAAPGDEGEDLAPGEEGDDKGGKGQKIQIEVKAHLEAFTAAASDPGFRFHFTAKWSDVLAKAKRIRKEGHVRITHASLGMVIGEVRGDHDTYESGIQRPLGHRQSIQHWACGCPWASFHQDNSLGTRYAGRPCSHVMALQFEAQARGMFGKEVARDERRPSWAKDQVVVKSWPPYEGPPHGGHWTDYSLAPAMSSRRTAAYMMPSDEPDWLRSHLQHHHHIDPASMDRADLEPEGLSHFHFLDHKFNWTGDHQHTAREGIPGEERWPDVFRPEQGFETDPWGGMTSAYSSGREHLGDPGGMGPFQRFLPWSQSSLRAEACGGNHSVACYYHHPGDCPDYGMDHTAESLRHPRPGNFRSYIDTNPKFDPDSQKPHEYASHVMYGFLGNRPAGALHFSQSDDGQAYQVEMLHTRKGSDFRAKGLASALMDDLYGHVRRNGQWLNHGWRTEDGNGWWGTYREPHPEVNVHHNHPDSGWKDYFSPRMVAADAAANWSGSNGQGAHTPIRYRPGDYPHDEHDEMWTHARGLPAGYGQFPAPVEGLEPDFRADWSGIRVKPDDARHWDRGASLRPVERAIASLLSAGEDPAEVSALVMLAGLRATADQANAPWPGGSESVSDHPPQKPYGATEPPNKDQDPGSYGFLSAPDPDNWGSIQEGSYLQSPLSNTAAMTCRHGSAGWCGTCEHEAWIAFGDTPAQRTAALPPHLAYPDISDWQQEDQDSFGYSDRSNTAGPATSISPGDPQGIRMEEARKDCPCCGGTGEHATGRECYGCDASGSSGDYSGPLPCDGTKPYGVDNEGHQVELDPQDGWQHLDGSVSHDDGTTVTDHPVTTAELRDEPEPALPSTTGDDQDEGEQQREQAGIDGTMGDAQDVPHGFVASQLHGGCAICGLDHGMRASAAADGTIGGGDAGDGSPSQAPADVASLGEFGAIRQRPEPSGNVRRTTAGSPMGDLQRETFPQAQAPSPVTQEPGMGSMDEELSPDSPSIQTIGNQQWSGGGADSDEVDVPAGQPGGSIDDIVASFQRSAGARQFAQGPGGRTAMADGDIAAAARQFLSKTADVLPPKEAQELIDEGRGERARNLGLLRLEGTHYEGEDEDLQRRGVNLDDFDDDVISV